ncbi:unnamed protein product [Effrenium voratum]|uniref:RING-CH-type domain-containing protein n=1 Tax=Effrenium voratum TaxID=2562239 RepID=A0AA36JMC0_9DINO|nr:unnamed protein product [Effrenium voratum]CAJ1455108.1 unnamed protein product [Effrenium voratum]
MDDLAGLRRRRAAQWEASKAEAATSEAEAEVSQATNAETDARRESEERCCRICFDSETSAETGRLFSPCRCQGSMRFVHVSCLNNWRAASCNERSYYSCDACHYEYRLQRLWVADVLLSAGFQLAVNLGLFALSALLGGVACYHLAPQVLDLALDQLYLPPVLRFLFSRAGADQTSGNAACWRDGYTFEACCGRGAPGNPACWDDRHSWESCCEVPALLNAARTYLGYLLRVLFCGGLGLGVLGFGLYLKRSLQELHGTGGNWQIFLFVAYLSTFGQALARLVVLLGCAVAWRELFLQLQFHCKRLSGELGERILEVA